MSQSTQLEFTRTIIAQHEHSRGVLDLGGPQFRYDGFISYATMGGSTGMVELVCGPPEYHVEVFLTILKNGERWDLARLMEIPSVRLWLMAYPAEESKRSVVELDAEWIFRLLETGLKEVGEFGWLYRAQ